MYPYTLSSHARHRSAQRNLSDEDIDFIVQHGQHVHRTGVIFCQLRHKDLPTQIPGNHRYRQLVGTTVVLCRCGHYIVTLYREAKAFHRDRCKRKYNIQATQDMCPCCRPVA
jgi:hypothetical protein